jgi:hypothetical protein
MFIWRQFEVYAQVEQGYQRKRLTRCLVGLYIVKARYSFTEAKLYEFLVQLALNIRLEGRKAGSGTFSWDVSEDGNSDQDINVFG